MTVRNIRLWDPQVLLRSYGQLQELRPYYSFTTVSVDRYPVNGVYTQTMLAPRELSVAGLPPQAQTWVNQHITYTHGYGVTVSAVNQVSSGGSPDFLVQDVPPVSSAPSLAITQPQIYYGLLGTDYVLVKTKYQTFDYPGPSGNVYAPYTGSGGIPIGSFLNRLAFTIRFGDIRFFTTSAITGQQPGDHPRTTSGRASRRPRRSCSFDANPYMVIADGRLYWIADAYTTTDRIPYSQPDGGLNYIRNSVKVVIDAYNGIDALLRVRPAGPAHPDLRADVPRHVRAGGRRCRTRCASTCATRRTSSRSRPQHVRHLSRHRPVAALQQGQPVGDPDQPVDLGDRAP